MRFYKTSLTVILMFFCTGVFAQGFVENALLFSRTKPGGSARIQAMGGSQIALGGDFSSGLSNPAGLGMYNRSEFTFSPGLSFYTTDSNHNGTSESDSKPMLTIPGISFVSHFTPKNENFRGSLGVSLTRINDFNKTFRYNGEDSNTSIIDFFLEDANAFGLETGDIRTALAYDNYLIDDATAVGGNEGEYFSEMEINPDDPTDIRRLRRQGNVDVKGRQNQWSIGYGGNYKDKFYFGVNIGLTNLRYRFESNYSESDYFFDLDPTFVALNSMSVQETIEIDGSGVNATLGMIFRPVNFFQVGVSLLTPTFYNLTYTHYSRVSSEWDNFDYLGSGEILRSLTSEYNEPIIYEYNLTTPMKLNTGAAFIVGKYGIITGDLEFINPSKAKYSSTIPNDSYEVENDDIKYFAKNRMIVNYRFGVEGRYDIFRLRAGYNFQQNPYVMGSGRGQTNIETKTLSVGAGVRLKTFFVDFALLSTKGNSSYSEYAMLDNTGPVVDQKNKITSGMLTLGVNF
jgi:hypothetical protein